jgi:hypothetical protein
MCAHGVTQDGFGLARRGVTAGLIERLLALLLQLEQRREIRAATATRRPFPVIGSANRTADRLSHTSSR